MQNPFIQKAGGVLSADIAVSEHEKELDFYSKILTTGSDPLWREDLLNNLGLPIIGLGKRTPEYAKIPTTWMPHILVADVLQSVAVAIENGAEVIMQSEAGEPEAQWAALVDPLGAAFGIIPIPHDETYEKHREDRLGRIVGLSLHTSNVVASKDFYSKVIGWSAGPRGDGAQIEQGYAMHIDEGNSAADIYQAKEDENELSNVWLIHLPVDDIDESLRRVKELGGEIVSECTKTRRSIVRDPEGVLFSLEASE